MYPGDPGEPGSDCAGIVIAVSDQAEGFKGSRRGLTPIPDDVPPGHGDEDAETRPPSGLRVGDRVFGLAHGCLGTLVSGPASMMARMPPAMSMQVRKGLCACVER